jgi:deoxycytidylate deaminase
VPNTPSPSSTRSAPLPVTGPELVFAVVGAIGADLGLVTRLLKQSLAEVAYSVEVVRLSELLKDLPGFQDLPDSPLDVRYERYMAAGTELREKTKRADALAILGVQAIADRRDRIADQQSSDKRPPVRLAYIIQSLKRPDEIETLRKIYSPGLFVVAAYSPRDRRLKRLEEQIADSYNVSPPSVDHRRAAEDLVSIDEMERGKPLGQAVQDTFPLADFFVDASAPESAIATNLKRFIALVFGYPFHSPTRDENGMFHARAAALRSAELGRQVGVAITNVDGDVLAVGTNEVPRAGGGLYWTPQSNEPDHRDFTKGEDTSDRMKRSNLAEVLSALKTAGLFSEDVKSMDEGELLMAAATLLKTTRMMNAIEFGRAVHAEMDAITGAARRGVSTLSATLYTTTFPCHNCARHIVSAGVARVVYIEPYAKSLASEFHQDSISVEENDCVSDRVLFEPFVGVAPRQYMNLFSAVPRKTKNGRIIEWDASTSQPRLHPPTLNYTGREVEQTSDFSRVLTAAGIVESNTPEEPNG